MSGNVNDTIASLEAVDDHALSRDPSARVALLAATRRLAARLETPLEFSQRLMWQEPTGLFSIKFGFNTDLFEHLGPASTPPKSIRELAKLTSVEGSLLTRVARSLSANHILRDYTDPQDPSDCIFGPTTLSAFLCTPEARGGMRQAWIKYRHDFVELADYLESLNYQSPTDNRDGPFQRRFGLRGSTFFESIHKKDRQDMHIMADDFQAIMALMKQGQASLLDVCDVGSLLRERPARSAAEERHLFVDVGGGAGSNAIDLRERFKNVPGKVEVQDLESVIKAAKDAGAEAKGVGAGMHDFFSPQPARGARFYCLSIVLHDWPDPEAREILEALVPAMEKGYSSLLVSEMVILNRDCPPMLAAMDINMMTYFAGKERTELDWRTLLGSVGLEVIKIHTMAGSMRSVLECEL